MLPKINPLDLRVVSEFLGSSGPENRSIVDDISAICDLQGFSHIVVSHKNTNPFRFQMINDFLNLNHGYRIDPGKRLVQENKFRRNHKRPCNFDAAPFPSRKWSR